MADEDIPVEDLTSHPLADEGLIPRKDWLPMIPFDVSDWDDRPVPRYAGQPGSTKAQIRADIIASRKRAGLPPLPKEEVDAIIAQDLL